MSFTSLVGPLTATFLFRESSLGSRDEILELESARRAWLKATGSDELKCGREVKVIG